RVRAAGQHEGAARGAEPQLEQAAEFERAQRLAHGVAADPEHLREVAFRRQLVAGTQLALGDAATQLVRHFLVDALRADRLGTDGGGGWVVHRRMLALLDCNNGWANVILNGCWTPSFLRRSTGWSLAFFSC